MIITRAAQLREGAPRAGESVAKRRPRCDHLSALALSSRQSLREIIIAGLVLSLSLSVSLVARSAL